MRQCGLRNIFKSSNLKFPTNEPPQRCGFQQRRLDEEWSISLIWSQVQPSVYRRDAASTKPLHTPVQKELASNFYDQGMHATTSIASSSNMNKRTVWDVLHSLESQSSISSIYTLMQSNNFRASLLQNYNSSSNLTFRRLAISHLFHNSVI